MNNFILIMTRLVPLQLILMLLLLAVPGIQNEVLGANTPPSETGGEEADDDDDGCDGEGGSNECVSFSFPGPIVGNSPGINGGHFNVLRDKPTPLLFTPQSLHFYNQLNNTVAKVNNNADKLPPGIGVRVSIIRQNEETTDFDVPDAQSVGSPIGKHYGEKARITLLNENLFPVTTAPKYILERWGNGSELLYEVSGRVPIRYRTADGRIYDLEGTENPIEIIRSDDINSPFNVIRQVKSAGRFIDIVVTGTQSYEIRYYNASDSGGKDSNGFYVPVGIPYRVYTITNPSGDSEDIDTFRVTDSYGSRAIVTEFVYEEASNQWTMIEGNGLRKEIKSKSAGTNPNELIATRILRNSQDEIISKKIERIEEFSFGEAVIEKIQDPDGIALVKTSSYYVNASEVGKYGQVHTIKSHDGSWKVYDYDTEGRVTGIIKSWKDLPINSAASVARSVEYNYNPVDGGDTLLEYDSRYRTMTEKVEDQVVRKTFRAYLDVNGEKVEIEEKASTPTANYGDISNLRTTTTYYAPVEIDDTNATDQDRLRAGRIKSVEYSDGRLMVYDYDETSTPGELVETESLVSTANPAGVEGKSTRTEKTYDVAGNLIIEKSYVYSGGWQLVSTMEYDYDGEQQLVQSRQDGRVILDQTWDSGLKTSMTDETGTVTEYTYDDLDRMETETVIAGGGVGDIMKVYDRNLGEIDCGCDGSVTTITQAQGGLTLSNIVKADALSRKTEITDQQGYTTFISYQDEGRTEIRTHPDGSITTISKYLDGQLKSVTGTAVVDRYLNYTVNGDGSISTTENLATPSSPRYTQTITDMLGRVAAIVRPAYSGGIDAATMTYDNRGLLVAEARTETATALHEYDELGNRIRSGLDMDNNGQLDLASSDRITDSDTTFTQTGGQWYAATLQQVYPDAGSTSATTVSQSQQRLSGLGGTLLGEMIQTDIHGNITTVTSTISRAAKEVTRTVDLPDSNINQVEVITNGYRQSMVDSRHGGTTTYTYDNLGRMTAVTDPRTGTSVTAYNSTNQVTSVTDAASNTTSFAYYTQGEIGAGQRKSVTNALSKTTYFEYDAQGRQTRQWGADTYPTEQSYSVYGEMQTLQTYRAGSSWFSATWPTSPGTADITTWSYHEPTGLLTRKEYADTNGTDYTWTDAGRLATRDWARGITTTYSYNLAGELTLTDYSDSTADVTQSYDRLGRVLSRTDATGTHNMAYNTQLQLATETLPAGFYNNRILTRNYQGNGSSELPGRSAGYELGTGADPDADHATTYSYQTNGRLNAVADGNDTHTYSYVNNSNLLSVLSASAVNKTYSYEANRNVITQVKNAAGATTLSQYDYTSDALGRRSDRAQSGTAFTATSTDVFAYNDRSEVTGSTNATDTTRDVSYAYDAIGNRSSATNNVGTTTYATNALNQYTSITQSPNPSITPSHDSDGNTTIYVRPSDSKIFNLSYDGENQLLVFEPGVPVSGDQKVENIYDGQSRRVQKTVSEWSGSAWGIVNDEKYLYDGWNMIATYDAINSDALIKTYTWGSDLSGAAAGSPANAGQGAGGVGGLLSISIPQSPNPSISYSYTYDANGNVSELVDSVGSIVAHYEYDPFGRIAASTGAYADENPYRFSTKYQDTETGLLYYGFRYYSPELGRWLNRDPIEEEGGYNLYGFVYNEPVNYIDVLGNKPRRNRNKKPQPKKPTYTQEYVLDEEDKQITDMGTDCEECKLICVYVPVNSLFSLDSRTDTFDCTGQNDMKCPLYKTTTSNFDPTDPKDLTGAARG